MQIARRVASSIIADNSSPLAMPRIFAHPRDPKLDQRRLCDIGRADRIECALQQCAG